MEETLAELFAQHPLTGSFRENPLNAFCMMIGEIEYRSDETLGLIGLYSGQYTICYSPGE